MPGNDAILVVDNVHATYNHAITALHGVSFELRRGEILALLGANGAGKSTTLKAVSNLLPAERGQINAGAIRFEGSDVSQRKPGELVRAGLVQVLEGRHCFKSLTVEENLVSGGIGRSGRRAEINQDLQRIYEFFPRLAQKRRTLSGLTSGGEQQMTAIGRALMSRPRLLVLDEPSMGLAPLVVQDIFLALRKLNREAGLSILVAEQNSAVALKYADHATVLENGVSVLSGPAAELRQREDVRAFYLGQQSAPATQLPHLHAVA
ncbi:ABC transporter ATP-binding protein [Mesorhizobium sp. M00.F.Ca.ET.217.01.1.1]|uniref:ABC transporter ATP-binding protein n=1 Tax=Mesorhizobium sp. M00.F.Ca.ET.217.01.1.1 TaxID=2500529 RepID=UPI000FDB9496|nr:ABC transporter ATP-binding protein [Mesorhizobium sp. M00.F.Ca.ET.217.01.1.1]TGQ13553.1 ABC transporter ATP-binding protein [Mesorhizobium sp. M00.F.Ca.ET.217.01.1.1]TGV85418.1 ABC transporter ATP-binding protein [Mesorhizobium sp. M00.F.Ca.ET.158.01.1.1]